MIATNLTAIVRSVRRHAGTSIAIAASLAFALQPCLVVAQTTDDAPPQTEPKAKPRTATQRKVHKHTAADAVTDDLNRRASEQATQVVNDMIAKAAATGNVTKPPVLVTPAANAAPASPPAKFVPSEPPTVAAIPPRAPVVMASLTPAISTTNGDPSNIGTSNIGASLNGDSTMTSPPPVAPRATTAKPTSLPLPKLPVVSRQMAQLTQQPAPAPVPIQPPAYAAPVSPTRAPAVVGGAPGRTFGQSQLVATQPPTLTLEVNKGTAIRLPGPATTVFVAAPDIADVQVKSPGMVYVFAKKPGDTVLYAVDDQDRVLLNTIVSVTSPLSRIKGALDQLHPNNGVTFDNQGESIVLGGTVRSALIAEDARRLALQQVAGNAAKVVDNIRIDAPTQVQLQVKIAEVQRDALKRVGINWQNINNIALFGLGPFQAGAAVATVQSIGGPASGAISLASNNGSLTSYIDLLATQSQASVLAEPNLIAMSGETASFLAGGEVPVLSPQTSASGGATVSVTYKQVGVSLSFTPTIVGDRINLKVSPEVSQISTSGQVSVAISSTASIVVPAFQTRRASTTVELGSGQSFAIAGLLQRTSQQDITKLPGLGDVPVLGALFKSDAYQRDETELVIIVTPYFVEPTSGKLRTPLTGRVPPTDADRLLYGRFNSPTPPQRLSVGQQTGGPTAGFKLN